jgi:glycosyltransferase involved in cell wall biosynthesis
LVIAILREGLDRPDLEAMACRATVIAAQTGALPEVVGNAGQLVDPSRLEMIAAAMAIGPRDIQVLAQAAREGPLRAAGFNWQHTTADITTLLKELH